MSANGALAAKLEAWQAVHMRSFHFIRAASIGIGSQSACH